MARDVIKSRVQLLHDTEAHWRQVESTFVPLAGEPCITIDGPNRNKVKYGDGLHTWGEIEYSGDTGPAVDNRSITVIGNSYLIKGFDSATVGQVPKKNEDGEVEWVTPPRCNVEKVYIGDLDTELVPTIKHEIIIPRATNSTIGVVKGSEQISVEDDGSLIITEVPSEVITDLESLADDISSILELTPLASSVIRTSQLEIVNGVLGIKKVDSDIIYYKDTTVEDKLGTLEDAVTWAGF
jgi:hypothetical protein